MLCERISCVAGLFRSGTLPPHVKPTLHMSTEVGLEPLHCLSACLPVVTDSNQWEVSILAMLALGGLQICTLDRYAVTLCLYVVKI